MKKSLPILFVIFCGIYHIHANAAEQIIETVVPSNVDINQQVNFQVNYRSANPTDDTLTGLGLRVHWNSQQLQFNNISNILNTGLFAQGITQNDVNNLDGDFNTDKFILISWFDVSGAWPNSGQNLTLLYSLQFTTTNNFNSTAIKYSASSTANGYNLQFTSANLFRNNQNPNQNQAQPQGVPMLSWVGLMILGGLLSFSSKRKIL